jgi:hypothetical protein
MPLVANANSDWSIHGYKHSKNTITEVISINMGHYIDLLNLSYEIY